MQQVRDRLAIVRIGRLTHFKDSVHFVSSLAADLLRVGKVDKALALLSSKTPNRRMSISPDENLVTFDLYYAEALALKGNLTKRSGSLSSR